MINAVKPDFSFQDLAQLKKEEYLLVMRDFREINSLNQTNIVHVIHDGRLISGINQSKWRQ